MEKNLTKYTNFYDKKIFKSCIKNGGGNIQGVKIDNELIILKTFGDIHKHKIEKNNYMIISGCHFAPILKYYDDKNRILGITDCGISLDVLKQTDKNRYNKYYKLYNKQIEIATTELLDKYNLYHNDLEYKNICVDENNKIRLIDFDWAMPKICFYGTSYKKTNFICEPLK